MIQMCDIHIACMFHLITRLVVGDKGMQSYTVAWFQYALYYVGGRICEILSKVFLYDDVVSREVLF